MNQQPLLSICIPTYNRVEQLANTLDSIVNQEDFDETVEIVISDNHSTDNTYEIVAQFIRKYPNIHYFCNDENLGFQNLTLAVKRGTGLLRKLSNDTVEFLPGSIKYIKSLITRYKVTKPLLYFFQEYESTDDITEVQSLNEFMTKVSYMITYIRCVAFWDDDCRFLYIMDENSDTDLEHEPLILKLVSDKKEAVLISKKLFYTQSLGKKNLAYGLFRVFYTNYLSLLEPYHLSGEISESTFQYLKKDLLMRFFIEWICNTSVNSDRYVLNKDENLRELVEQAYKDEDYYGKFEKKLSAHLKIAKLKRLVKIVLNKA